VLEQIQLQLANPHVHGKSAAPLPADNSIGQFRFLQHQHLSRFLNLREPAVLRAVTVQKSPHERMKVHKL